MKARKFVFVLALAMVLVCAGAAVAQARTLNSYITGLVLLPDGKPAAGVSVQAWTGMYNGLWGKDWLPVGTPVITGRNGGYKLKVPPGTYRVWFVPADLETYCMEAYPNAPTPYHGDDIVVRAGRTASRVSVSLDTSPGAMEGTVYDATTGEPVEGIKLRLGFQAVAIINTEFGTTWSDAEGNYRFAGLKSWNWGAWSFDERGLTPVYLDVLNFDENRWVEQGIVTEGVDFDLEPEGWVSVGGYVTNESLAGIDGVTIRAQLWESDGYYDYTSITTADGGYFQFQNLPAGQWMFYAECPGYHSRYYNGGDQAGEPIDIHRGHAITLGEWTLFPDIQVP